jgi:hypothetical protein
MPPTPSTPTTSNAKRKLPQKNKYLYDKFKYGLEYETLIYSPRVTSLYEVEKQRLNSQGVSVACKCDLTKDIFNSKFDKEKTAPYRKFIQESIQARAISENANDIKIRYEFGSSWVKCPIVSEDQNEWIITHDDSVQSNPPHLENLYHFIII